DNADQAFISGKTAYYIDSSGNSGGFLQSITDFKWDCGLPPQGANNPTPVTEMYGPINAIPKNDEAKQLAGWLLLKWLATPGPMAEWVIASSYFPTRASVAASADLAGYYENNPYAAKLVKDVAPLAKIIEPHPALVEIRSQITPNIVNEVLLGQLSP